MLKHRDIGLKFLQAFTDIARTQSSIKKYDIKKLAGNSSKDSYRLRIGSYRAIFRIMEEKLIVFIFLIGTRDDVYKKWKQSSNK